jgi:hypothetical protein
MPVDVKEWTQRRWARPGVDLLRPNLDPGPEPSAFFTSYALAPDPYTGVLKRAPAWQTAAAVPAGCTVIRAGFYDRAMATYNFVCRYDNKVNYIYTYDWTAWGGPTELISTTGSIYGKAYRDVLHWGGYLWALTNGGQLWAATDYQNGLDLIYTDTVLQVLGSMNDRLFAGDTAGDIFRLATGPALGAYLPNVAIVNPAYMVPFRQYLTVICEEQDSIELHRLPDWQAHALHQLGRLPCTPFPDSNYGCPYALFDDKIWILTGQQPQSDGTFTIECYAFDGNSTQRAAVATGLPDASTAVCCGLIVYQNRLLLQWGQNQYATHHFQVLVGDHFEPWAPLTGLAKGQAFPFGIALADTLVCATSYDSGTTPLFHYARRDALMDGYVITSRLDMAYPGRLKRLEQITVILDGEDDDFDVIIKYRVDDASTWTTAGTVAGSRIAQALKIRADFYLLQVRIDLADGSGEDLDIGIEAINVTYSINE